MSHSKGILIAIDGPGGVGKSTVARELAQKLGFYFFSSGLIYRAMAWRLLELDWNSDQPPNPERLAGFHLGIDSKGGVLVNGQTVPVDLHEERISLAASKMSSHPKIRELANQVQKETVNRIREEGHFGGVILEGRDIGSVVFPEADHKFYLTADDSIRAERRYLEKKDQQAGLTREVVLASLKDRDSRDQSREVAPMKPAEDAQIINTSHLTMEQVMGTILEQINRQP